jgi:pimeloyl-ACP methyl ester carboxylesterase
MQTWIFIRGLTRSSAHWGDFIADFEGAMPARVIALDLPGNGSLCRQLSPASVAEMAEACRAQCLSMGEEGPVNILALSLGAMVATQWANQWPGEVQRLVLLSTSMRPLNPFWQRMQPAALGTLLWSLAGAGTNAIKLEQAILRLTANHPRYEVLMAWSVERMRNPVSARNALRQLWAAARFRVPGKPPIAPTLVFASEMDRLVSVECTRALMQHWGCEGALHPTAGHDLTLDDGPWVIEELTRWMQRVSSIAT